MPVPVWSAISELYEEFPAQHHVDVSRRHRWIRGDWQIAQWLFPRVPGFDSKFVKNPISGLSRWKIFDNLRRSLVPFALTLMLILSWVLFTPVWFGTVLLLGILLLPPILMSFVELFQKTPEPPLEYAYQHHFARYWSSFYKDSFHDYFSAL